MIIRMLALATLALAQACPPEDELVGACEKQGPTWGCWDPQGEPSNIGTHLLADAISAGALRDMQEPGTRMIALPSQFQITPKQPYVTYMGMHFCTVQVDESRPTFSFASKRKNGSRVEIIFPIHALTPEQRGSKPARVFRAGTELPLAQFKAHPLQAIGRVIDGKLVVWNLDGRPTSKPEMLPAALSQNWIMKKLVDGQESLEAPTSTLFVLIDHDPLRPVYPDGRFARAGDHALLLASDVGPDQATFGLQVPKALDWDVTRIPLKVGATARGLRVTSILEVQNPTATFVDLLTRGQIGQLMGARWELEGTGAGLGVSMTSSGSYSRVHITVSAPKTGLKSIILKQLRSEILEYRSVPAKPRPSV